MPMKRKATPIAADVAVSAVRSPLTKSRSDAKRKRSEARQEGQRKKTGAARESIRWRRRVPQRGQVRPEAGSGSAGMPECSRLDFRRRSR